MSIQQFEIKVGESVIRPTVKDGLLQSIGAIEVHGVPLRGPGTRFLPWVDTFEGGVFNRFEFLGWEPCGEGAVLHTLAVDDPDYPFRERRDSSGDICFRATNWDAEPLAARLDIHLQPSTTSVDGRDFSGFKYWFEWKPAPGREPVPIHRLLDRQTWELGGNLDDVRLICRNWLTPPRVPLSTGTSYSTVGLEEWAQLLPGNLWARWSLLPSFDLQYSRRGILLGHFDTVSLIRSVLETNAGEPHLRVLDLHLFEQSDTVTTNAKTILFCPDKIDETEAVNLWTRVHDAESTRAREFFQLPPEPAPALVLGDNQWKGVDFTTSYSEAVAIAAEFGIDYVFIDSVFEHQEAYNEALDAALAESGPHADPILGKMDRQNMCVTLDFEVAQQWGGEDGLRRLCRDAEAQGVGIISWMAAHLSPNTILRHQTELGAGKNGIFAAKESGTHPDTGYAYSCWPVNLNTPIADKMTAQLVGVCERTGLRGYLWDSFSNLGWWQLDYSSGSMRPQIDAVMSLYRALEGKGLYLMLEALVQFCGHSCCGLHGGNVYAGDLLPYSYGSSISLGHGKYHGPDSPENLVLRGLAPLDVLFEPLAHRRAPSCGFVRVPRSEWDETAVRGIRELFALYREHRDFMIRRTLLAGGDAVLWTGGDRELLFVLRDLVPPALAPEFALDWREIGPGEPDPTSPHFARGRVYARDARID